MRNCSSRLQPSLRWVCKWINTPNKLDKELLIDAGRFVFFRHIVFVPHSSLRALCLYWSNIYFYFFAVVWARKKKHFFLRNTSFHFCITVDMYYSMVRRIYTHTHCTAVFILFWFYRYCCNEIFLLSYFTTCN